MFFCVLVFVNLNQSISVDVPIKAEIFVFTAIVLAADSVLFDSYVSEHVVDAASVVKFVPAV